MEYAPNEKTALWLISHRSICDSLNVVRLINCKIDATYMLKYWEDGQRFDGPLIELLKSESISILDLSNNPLFVIT